MPLQEDIQGILRSLTEVLKARGITRLVELLCHATVDTRETNYDNWNGGTYGYSVTLRVPVQIYAKLQDELESVEKDLHNKLAPLVRSYDNEYIQNIIIEPKLIESEEELEGSQGTVNDRLLETPTFWQQGYFRLFLSHVSKHKQLAAELQKEFRHFGISLFVAHEDIEPNKEWQNEIELALSSMDALVALLTEGFQESKWCDQEVGVAIGRNVLVVPIRIGIDPYGFIGKFQGISANSKTHSNLCEEVFKALLRSEATKDRLARAIVHKLCTSDSFQESINTVKLLEIIKADLTAEMSKKLSNACESNSQVKGAFGVVRKINSILNVKNNG